MSAQIVNVPAFDGEQREVALVWRLKKDSRYAECRLFTHPVGAELRLDVGGEFLHSQASADTLALIDLAATWKAQFQEKGWSG